MDSITNLSADLYRVTIQVVSYNPLPSRQKLCFIVHVPHTNQNLCFDVNGRFDSTYMGTLYHPGNIQRVGALTPDIVVAPLSWGVESLLVERERGKIGFNFSLGR